MSAFSQKGGARLDHFNATYPFATLSGDSDALHLTCFRRQYHFPRGSIRRLSRYRGYFSVGLRIEHTQESAPQFVVFWASLLFWTSAFQRLRTELVCLGYDVAA